MAVRADRALPTHGSRPLAIEWGCEGVTLDRDFARFASPKWRTPGDA
jgi:hypothetical protein